MLIDSKIDIPTALLTGESKTASAAPDVAVKPSSADAPRKPAAPSTSVASKKKETGEQATNLLKATTSETPSKPDSTLPPVDPKPGVPATPKNTGTSNPAALVASSNSAVPLAMPDRILTAGPILRVFGKVSSRLSPAMKVLLISVLLPSFLSLFYFGLWASPMYISEARFAVRGSETGGMAGGLAALLAPSGASVGADANIVAEYIQSPDIMEAIDGDLDIFKHFSNHDHDLISRLAGDATRDDRLSYWKWAVKPSFDPGTGIIVLKVKAYDSDTSKKLAEAVLAKSEALVNAMSRRAQDDAITLAMNEVKTAEARVSRVQEAMRAFRNRSGMLDPASTAGGLQGIVSQLESEAVKVRAEIAEVSTYMSKDAPALVGLRARLAAVEKQLALEKLRLAGEAHPGSLTSFAGEYEGLQTENDFARQQLVSAMASLEAARVKAEAKSRYVVAFQSPLLPDESLYPRPFLFTAYVFVGALALAGLCYLIVAAVREHAGF